MKWNEEDRSLHGVMWLGIGWESSSKQPSSGNLDRLLP
jgi:hypothetical protein